MDGNLWERLGNIERQLSITERQVEYCEDNNLTALQCRFTTRLKRLEAEFTITYRLLADYYKGVWE